MEVATEIAIPNPEGEGTSRPRRRNLPASVPPEPQHSVTQIIDIIEESHISGLLHKINTITVISGL